MINLQQKEIIKRVTKKLNPLMVGVFGSYARNEQTEKSDLDLLIEFESNVNLLDIIGLEQDLSELLGIKVDLVTMRSINDSLREHIEKDLKMII